MVKIANVKLSIAEARKVVWTAVNRTREFQLISKHLIHSCNPCQVITKICGYAKLHKLHHILRLISFGERRQNLPAKLSVNTKQEKQTYRFIWGEISALV